MAVGRFGAAPPWVLVGGKPADGVVAAAGLAGPVVLVTDPVDGPPPAAARGMTVLEVPFKSDPLSLVHATLPHPVAAVVSFTELGLLPAALLAAGLGLPGVPVATVLRTRDKLLMRTALRGVLRQPAFGVCGRDVPAAADYPVVIKPRDGSGSRGVQYVGDPAAFAVAAAGHVGWLWEHYVDGAEYSVESVTLAGRHHVLGITEKHTTGPPHFVETGHVVPAPLAPQVAEAVRAVTATCLDTLGVTVGPAHTEVKVSDGHVVLVETHTRAGGDRIPLLTRLVTGHDQWKLALRSLAEPGLRALPTPAPARSTVAAVRYFPWQRCSIAAVEGVEACRRQPGVVEAQVSVHPGQTVPVWRYSHERPGFVVVEARDRHELERRLDAAVAQVRLVRADGQPSGSAPGTRPAPAGPPADGRRAGVP